MALVHVATIQYGGLIDIIVPVVAGLAFLVAAVLELRGGAQGQRQRYDPRYYDRGASGGGWFHLAWFRPRRFLPERFDGVVAVANGVVCLLGAAMFLGIALSVILD